MMNFQVGDKVKMVRNPSWTGVVQQLKPNYDGTNKLVIYVNFDNNPGMSTYYWATDFELIEKKKSGFSKFINRIESNV